MGRIRDLVFFTSRIRDPNPGWSNGRIRIRDKTSRIRNTAALLIKPRLINKNPVSGDRFEIDIPVPVRDHICFHTGNFVGLTKDEQTFVNFCCWLVNAFSCAINNGSAFADTRYLTNS
jgi:hypothetical protein